MKLEFNEKYKPSKDVVFSIMFEGIEMFTMLLNAVTNSKHNIVSVVSQASRYNEQVDEKTIRFDTRGVDEKGRVYTLDMQKSYLETRHTKRTVYYACREISKQQVVDFRYEDLLSVCVSFVVTNRGKQKIEKIQLKKDNGEIYTDLLTLYNVYLPKKICSNHEADNDIEVFMDFFSINDTAMAKQFEEKYIENPLAERLIQEYNRTVRKDDLNTIAEGGYFMFKATQEDFDRQRKEGRAEGEAIGEERGIRKSLISLFKKGLLSLADASREANMSEKEFEELAASMP